MSDLEQKCKALKNKIAEENRDVVALHKFGSIKLPFRQLPPAFQIPVLEGQYIHQYKISSMEFACIDGEPIEPMFVHYR